MNIDAEIVILSVFFILTLSILTGAFRFMLSKLFDSIPARLIETGSEFLEPLAEKADERIDAYVEETENELDNAMYQVIESEVRKIIKEMLAEAEQEYQELQEKMISNSIE